MSSRTGELLEDNVLHALLPGARVNERRRRKISVNFGFCRDVVRFNVGGTLFETYRSTLHKQPNSPLAYDSFLRKYYRPNTDDYFFDRDPEVFRAILNYLRTGSFHLPSYICGPAVREELQFWGVEDYMIERCCWSHYNSWNATLEALNQLERDRKGSLLDNDIDDKTNNTNWGRWQLKIWNFLNTPSSSKAAKFYAWFSLFFVILSIFSFVVETHPYFAYFIVEENKTGSVYPAAGSNSSSESNATNPTNDNSVIKVETVHPVFYVIDITCLSFFTMEYIVRIIFARRKFRYITSLMGVIDLFAIVPDYIQFIVYAVHPQYQQEGYVDYIAVLRIVRVLRIFRLIRHVPGLWILIYTLKSSIQELLLMIVFMVVGMLVFSSLIYFVDDRETFKSIPHSFWWSLVTMTTVGYGDMVPKTPWGYVIGSFTALSGLLMIGFSVPVLVNNFIMYYKHLQFLIEGERVDCKKSDVDDDDTDERDHGNMSNFCSKDARESENNNMISTEL